MGSSAPYGGCPGPGWPPGYQTSGAPGTHYGMVGGGRALRKQKSVSGSSCQNVGSFKSYQEKGAIAMSLMLLDRRLNILVLILGCRFTTMHHCIRADKRLPDEQLYQVPGFWPARFLSFWIPTSRLAIMNIFSSEINFSLCIFFLFTREKMLHRYMIYIFYKVTINNFHT
jgi:hypothetical protein